MTKKPRARYSPGETRLLEDACQEPIQRRAKLSAIFCKELAKNNPHVNNMMAKFGLPSLMEKIKWLRTTAEQKKK